VNARYIAKLHKVHSPGQEPQDLPENDAFAETHASRLRHADETQGSLAPPG
jgi:hypothetical protein